MSNEMKNNLNRLRKMRYDIDRKNKRLQSMSKNPFNYFARKKLKKEIQATEEGARDVLNTTVTQFNITSEVVNKNNYRDYGGKVDAAYSMYNAKSDYGGEMCKGVVDTRVSFIGGEGIAVVSEKKATQDWIDDFLEKNKLNGSRLIDFLRIGELEGKALLTLKTKTEKKDDKMIIVQPVRWYHNNYDLEGDSYYDIKKVTYTNDKAKVFLPDKFVYVHIGGVDKNINYASSRLHSVLTDIENFSRAKYDLRENTHLYGKIWPYWKTESRQEAIALNNSLDAADWKIGTAYAGTAQPGYLEPSGTAAATIEKDMLNSLKCISVTMGLPVHFLSYPELLSNRATADNLMEIVVSSTRADRLIWEEAFKELIEKARILAVNETGASNEILNGYIQVKLPVVSIALLKQIIEVWYPLLNDKIISLSTFREMLPGINQSEEEKLIKKEEKENAKKSAMNNNAFNQLNNNEVDDNNENQESGPETENNQ